MATENKLWLPPFSPKDQKRTARLQRDSFIQATYKRTGFSGKTLWDWLQLLGILAIPLVVAGATLYFTQQQALLSDTASKQQHQNDMQIALDQEQETTLKTYLDDMSDLLLNHGLRQPKPGYEVRQVARERTLTTLRRLDATRNRIVVQFLQDAQLIGSDNAVIDLSNADLRGDHLDGVNLFGVNLAGATLVGATLVGATLNKADLAVADLSGADLRAAFLERANLSWAGLSGTNLHGADLGGADLNNAFLAGADLRTAYLHDAVLADADLCGADLRGAGLLRADLSRANLSGADLRGAHLKGAINITTEQLDKAKSLQGATMPDGSIHP